MIYKKQHTVPLLLIVFLIITILFPPSQTQAAKDCSRTSVGFIPLMDMSASQTYQGEEGGLYGNGQNSLPSTHPHMQIAAQEIQQIQPRDASGTIDEQNGKIGFISLGMSNTFQEFGKFTELYDNDPQKSNKVVLLNGAFYGKTANVWAYPEQWADEHPDPWVNYFNTAISNAGLTKAQVQVVWVKLTNAVPIYPDDNFPVFSQKLQDDVAVVVKRIKSDYPNVKVVYFSSRIYGGYSPDPLSPEPSAYESAFAFKWLIQDQIAGGGTTTTTYDNSPVLLWGPYIWADGLIPRSDGLTYTCDDLTDGVHPSTSGRIKVADEMYEFFTQDALANIWFTGTGTLPTPTPTTPDGGVPGDANNDGQVDGEDFVVWLTHFGATVSGPQNGDFEDDGDVDIADYVIWINNYSG